MSILDKYPAPWRLDKPSESSGYCEGKIICDANGAYVVSGETVETDEGGEISAGVDVDGETLRLILAAPELLAALKDCVRFVPNTGGSGVFGEARRAYLTAEALIARIEQGT